MTLLNEAGDFVTNDIESAEALNTFFNSVFTSNTSFQKSQVPETRRNVWSKENSLLAEEDPVYSLANWTYINPLGRIECIHECWQRWQMGEISKNRKKSNIIPIFKKEKEYQGTTGWSASPQSLGRWWSNQTWKLFPNTWNHAQPACGTVHGVCYQGCE